MQKKKERKFIKGIGRIFNVRLWSDADRVKANGHYIWTFLKSLLVVQSPTIEESFEDAKLRLNLTDEELATRQRSLLKLSILMMSISILLFIYLIYQLVYGRIPGILLTVSLVSLAAVMAFRYHFWYYQIKEKKLGCSVREWFKYGLLGEKR